MSYEYPHLLDPDLYENGRVARFVDELLTPEIMSLSDDASDDYDQSLPPTDDILNQIEDVEGSAQARIINSARFDPFFVIFCSPEKVIECSSATPTTIAGIHDLLMFGKCLAFTHRTQSIFFATEIHHRHGKPIFGREIPPDADWGIFITGSSVRGNSFMSLINITTPTQHGFEFRRLKHDIGRDRQCKLPFSRFFQIADEHEFTDIVEQLHVINMRNPPSQHRDPLINFAIVLNALHTHGYLN